ncbi:MAG: hypothetical protein A2Y21_06555 [Clostridiales bacterium GWC2_40_7]|nr:MAG: hypothetical protein A2Y21_06555 [Clostridiales bacterium GWC2_40_7]
MALEIGLQIFSVKKEMSIDFWGTLEKIAGIGYKNIEFANHFAATDYGCGHNIDAEKLKGYMDRLGLKTIGMHISPLDKTDLDKVIDYNKIIGNKSLVCIIGYFTSKDEVLDFSKWLNRIGEKCRKNGMDLIYHNHYQEFQKFDKKRALDIIIENTDKDFVKFELDTYWAIRGGADPTEYLRKLGSRCELIHIKGLPSSVEPVNIFEIIGEDARIDGVTKPVEISKPEYFTEIGEGVIDIKSIIGEAQKIGVAKYLIVEQDRSLRNELESIEISYKTLSKVLR